MTRQTINSFHYHFFNEDAIMGANSNSNENESTIHALSNEIYTK